MKKITCPTTIEELLFRCQNIAGKTISDLALEVGVNTPKDLKIVKGWLGELLEICLGANAKNLPVPDFQNLGIELKTIPLSKNLTPAESTYVCTAPLDGIENDWESSRVRKKLKHVLWVPIESDKSIPFLNRRIATPFLWELTKEQEAILQRDWEELTSMLITGQVETLGANFGTYLQIRPKAANSKILVNTIDENGFPIKIVPKGFYLRSCFTKEILSKTFSHII